MSEEMYELLQRRDAELAALRVYVERLEAEYVDLAGRLAEESGRERGDETIRGLRYECGFKSDGRWRGE